MHNCQLTGGGEKTKKGVNKGLQSRWATCFIGLLYRQLTWQPACLAKIKLISSRSCKDLWLHLRFSCPLVCLAIQKDCYAWRH